MKKLLLLTTILLQFAFLFGQSTEWGQWKTVKCFKGLQFRTRQMTTDPDNFNQYIQFKNNYSQKVAFSFAYKEGMKELDAYIIENGGQYRTELNANATDDGLMWVSLKNNNLPYLTVGYLRFLINDEIDVSSPYEGCDDGANDVCLLCQLKPKYHCNNYDDSKQSTIKQTENDNSSNSLSVEELENVIITNLNNNLIDGKYPFYDKYEGNVELEVKNIKAARDAMHWSDSFEPNTLYISYYVSKNGFMGESNLFAKKFTELNIQKLTKGDIDLIEFQQGSKSYFPALFLYNFGSNDENYIELQNAIEALKNPNRNFGGSSNSGSMESTQVARQKEVTDNNTSTTSEEIDLALEQTIKNSNELLSKSNLTVQQLLDKAYEYRGAGDYLNYDKYLVAAALKGDVETMVTLGHNYRGGEVYNGISTTPIDYKKAKYWFQKAHNEDNTDGTNGLAFIYEKGWGENIDIKKAVEYYTISATKGNVIAMEYLGVIYKWGDNDFYKDIQKAKMWFEKACKAGSEWACEEM